MVGQNKLITVVVPLYNESAGLSSFHTKVMKTLEALDRPYELIYCNDGSTDNSGHLIREWRRLNPRIRLIQFSRNFGKESALSAGIAHAKGAGILMIDSDGQHPPELIPQFISAWEKGARVVVGVRKNNKGESLFKRLGSRLFYSLFNRLPGQKLVPGSTDFRLIDKEVQAAFLKLKETDRITRGLIDWLGFERQYIYFTANPRAAGTASYSRRKLLKLAANSFVSLSPTPLYVFGYLGVLITTFALLLGSSVFVEQLLLGDPLGWKFTGTAMLGTLILFMVGIILMSQGILSLYISHIHNQTKQRPLYIIDMVGSAGLEKEEN